jgi:uncharacterized membrane protein
MIYLGLSTKQPLYVKHLGFALLVFTILKILVYDMANVDRNLKVVLFLVVGILILAISYFYNRNKEMNEGEAKE